MSIFELLLFQYNQTGRHTFPVFGQHGLEGNHQYTCCSWFFSSCLLTVSLIPSVSVRCVPETLLTFKQNQKKGSKVCRSFELPLDLDTKPRGSCWFTFGFPLRAQRANCAQQHHSVTQWLTNALAIVVFDRDTNTRASGGGGLPGAARNTPRPLWCSGGSLVVAARLFWWWSVSRLVHMLFWSLLSEPGELTQTQLAWVEPPGVHRELKDMDPCQHISYIAHILQVQLRIRDRGPSPLAAHPAICPPGAGGAVA